MSVYRRENCSDVAAVMTPLASRLTTSAPLKDTAIRQSGPAVRQSGLVAQADLRIGTDGLFADHGAAIGQAMPGDQRPVIPVEDTVDMRPGLHIGQTSFCVQRCIRGRHRTSLVLSKVSLA